MTEVESMSYASAHSTVMREKAIIPSTRLAEHNFHCNAKSFRVFHSTDVLQLVFLTHA